MTTESTARAVEAPLLPARWHEKLLLAGALTLLLNSVLRGMRAPSRWAYTQALFNYDFGFTKRGLQGALISALDVPSMYHYRFFFWYSAALVALNVLLLATLVRRLCGTQNFPASAACYVFCSSLAVVVLAHTIGYGDHVGLLVTLTAIMIRNFHVRSIFVAISFSACVLIHETQLVIFFPVILIRFLADLRDGATPDKVLALCAVCTCVLVTFILVANTDVSRASATVMLESLQAKADYPLQKGTLRALTVTFHDFLAQMPEVWRMPEYKRFFLSTWIVTAPTIAYLINGSWQALAVSTQRRSARAIAIIASLSPLTLHAIGLDYNRWTTLAITTSFLTFAIVTQTLRPHASLHTPVPRTALAVPAAVVAMNLASSIPLFDGYIVQSFPYEARLVDMLNIVEGKAPFPPQPELCGGIGCATVIETLMPPQSAVPLPKLQKRRDDANESNSSLADRPRVEETASGSL